MRSQVVPIPVNFIGRTGRAPLQGSLVSLRSMESCDRSLVPIPINLIGRTSVRPYVRATNGAITCSHPVN
ncbi:MAG: hypothetical protein RIG63_10940 [Coleofasciculus chthonoplastes F3-SA18-01]|uniref:hypothetical protein n=1 Tax=Coleofasciculus chthonoplastes TaxID=64178 RepID=UPI0032FC54ED